MTCIVAVKSETKIVMGADSFNGNESKREINSQKLWVNGAWLCGASGHSRVTQLVQYVWELPTPSLDDAFALLVARAVPTLRTLLLAHGAARKDRDGMDSFDGSIVLAFQGRRLFTLHSDFSVHELDNYAAVGVGRPYAVGALFATMDLDPPMWGPEERVQIALRAAERHAAMVAPPFHILTQNAP